MGLFKNKKEKKKEKKKHVFGKCDPCPKCGSSRTEFKPAGDGEVNHCKKCDNYW